MRLYAQNPIFDGEIERILQNTWSAARDGTSGTVNIDINNQIQARGTKSGGIYDCGRGFLTFDLTSIPARSVIVSATLSLVRNGGMVADSAHGIVHLLKSTQASPTALIGADYIAYETTDFANTIDCSNLGSKIFTLNSSGLTYLTSKIGNRATFALLTDKDLNNVAPVSDGDVFFSSITDSITANRPVLTIRYSSPFFGGMI
jgi:hypothetical protein